jgi:multiple sugar transport system substrate-binding protein
MHIRSTRLLSVGAAVALAVSACAGQGGTPAPTAAPTVAPTAAATAAPPTAAASATASVAPTTAATATPVAFDWKKYSGTKITFLADQHPWTDGMNTLVSQFTAETGITVDVQALGEDTYFDKMEQVVRASKGTADVYFLPLDSTGYSQFTADGIEPLTPYLNDPTKTAADYDLADIPAGFLGGGTYPPGDANAQLYGIPISFETYILFYNKDLVAKYLGGTLPATFPDLIAAAEKINKDGAKDGVAGAVMRGIASDTIMDTLSGVVFNAWGSADLPSPYGAWFDGGWDKPRLDNPAVCQGLANYGKLLAAGPSNKFALDWSDDVTVFQQGKAAFFIDASLFSPALEDTKVSTVAGKVGYAVIPPVTAGGGSFSGHWAWGLGIPRNSTNKDAAWYFIQWMTNKANTAKIGASTGGAARMSAYSDPAYTSSLVPEYVTTVSEAMKTSRSTVIFKDPWKNGALVIVNTMLKIAQGADPTATCAAANPELAAAVK